MQSIPYLLETNRHQAMDAAERFLTAMEDRLPSTFDASTDQRAHHECLQSSSYFSGPSPRNDVSLTSPIEPHYNDLEDDPPLDDFGKTSVLPDVVEIID